MASSNVPDDKQETPKEPADDMPFAELIQNHHKQTVWGFQFGKESMRRAQENMRAARYKKGSKHSDSGKEDQNQPGSSKSLGESDHKTPNSQRHRRITTQCKRKKDLAKSLMLQNSRSTPLPLLSWADAEDVWLFMVSKEEASINLRNPSLFEDFANFMPQMRSILLDWIMEVCEVYRLRRVTYYLSVDYFDRFVSIRPDIPKNQLQLVGVTCLFLAAKLEEVYPPRVCEFSYVCDGACTPDDILNCELFILNSLGWDLSLMTPSDWLNLYMQLHFKADEVAQQRLHSGINHHFIFPQYSGFQFIRASMIIDIFSLDPAFLRFSYSTIAAGTMYYMYGKKVALRVSGLTWDQLKPCTEYMSIFYQIITNSNDPRLENCTIDVNQDEVNRSLDIVRASVKNLIMDENHSVQTHTINMEFFEKSAFLRLEQMGIEIPTVDEGDSDDLSELAKPERGISFDTMLQMIIAANAKNIPVQRPSSDLTDDEN